MLTCGELRSFDEVGVSYPLLACRGEETFMSNAGWMSAILTPHILFASKIRDFARIMSRIGLIAFHRASQAIKK